MWYGTSWAVAKTALTKFSNFSAGIWNSSTRPASWNMVQAIPTSSSCERSHTSRSKVERRRRLSSCCSLEISSMAALSPSPSCPPRLDPLQFDPLRFLRLSTSPASLLDKYAASKLPGLRLAATGESRTS